MFSDTYNQIQSQLRALGGMDDLICGELYMYSYLLLTLHDAQAFTLIFSYVGMLSKSKGQILRVAAIMHVLFQICITTENEDTDHDAIVYDDIISLDALKAAIDFIQTSLQHTCYIAGRSSIIEEVDMAQASETMHI